MPPRRGSSLTKARHSTLHAFRLLELFTLYLVLPGLVYTEVIPRQYRLLMLFGIAVTVAVGLFLVAVPRSRIGLARPLAPAALATLIEGCLYLLIPFLLLVLYHLAYHYPLFAPPRVSAALLALICVIYPLSAAAQELVYRAFFFHRYGNTLPTGALIVINAVLFGLVHLIYGHLASVLLTLVLGLLLAHLYARHRSLLGVWLLHVLAGLTVFAMGYRRWFYIGRIG